MQVLAVARDSLDGVADRVAKIEDGAQAALGFILAHHLGLDLAAAGHDGRQRRGIPFKQPIQLILQTPEQMAIGNDPVLDHLGQAGS